MRRTRTVRKPSRGAALARGLIGLAIASALVLMTLFIQSIGEVSGYACTLSRPRTLFALCAAVASLAAVTSLASAFRRPRAGVPALCVTAGCAIAWLAAGGLDALDCAFGV
jgi:hypothetical protein